MLETIYEVDENTVYDVERESVKFMRRRPTRLPYHICCSMLAGCILTLGLIIVVSLNPNLLTKHSTHKNSKTPSNILINFDDKLQLAMDIIEHLNIFSDQINEQLDLQPNTITFLTSTISHSSSENQNQNEVLWIYTHLTYPHSCIDNNQCKEYLNFKLKTSFTELSSLLTTIELDSYFDKQIQLDWCSLIENKTRAILVSLVSVITINQSTTISTNLGDRTHCENIDQNILLSKIIDRIIALDQQTLTNEIGKNSISINNFELEDEINQTRIRSTDTSSCTDHQTIYCVNNIYTKILLM